MKNIKLLAIGIVASALMFSACKKDEPKTDDKPSGSSLLTGKDWRLIGLTLTVPNLPPTDLYAQMDACDKDDLVEYLVNGDVKEKAGATKCDPTEPDFSISGKWALLNNNAQLRIIDGDTTLLTLQELTATSLRGSMSDSDPVSGLTYTTSFTFTKN